MWLLFNWTANKVEYDECPDIQRICEITPGHISPWDYLLKTILKLALNHTPDPNRLGEVISGGISPGGNILAPHTTHLHGGASFAGLINWLIYEAPKWGWDQTQRALPSLRNFYSFSCIKAGLHNVTVLSALVGGPRCLITNRSGGWYGGWRVASSMLKSRQCIDHRRHVKVSSDRRDFFRISVSAAGLLGSGLYNLVVGAEKQL